MSYQEYNLSQSVYGSKYYIYWGKWVGLWNLENSFLISAIYALTNYVIGHWEYFVKLDPVYKYSHMWVADVGSQELGFSSEFYVP